MLIFSLLIAFLINRAMERKRALLASIAVELCRLRRVKHLAEGLGDTLWRKRVFEALTKYQTKLSKDFLAYGQTLGSFRELTHLIYRYEPKNKHEEVLIADLLTTTRNIALERQKIEVYINDGLWPSSWLTLLAIALLLILLLLFNREPATLSQIGNGFGIAAILLALDFLRQKNSLGRFEAKQLEAMYKKNVAKTRE